MSVLKQGGGLLVGLGAFFALAGVAGAASGCVGADCAGFATCHGADPHEDPADGGADGRGDRPGERGFAFAPVSVQPRVMHGASHRIKLTVQRAAAQRDDIVVTVASLPAGVTVEPLTIRGTETSGELAFTVSASTPQGPFTCTVTGDASGETASTDLSFFVRGRPGTVDTTFATNGVVTLPTSTTGYETAVDSDGRIYIAGESTVRRLHPDGSPDTTFGSGGEAPKRVGAPVGVVIVGGAVYTSTVASATYIDKALLSGAFDPSYGGGDGQFHTSGYPFGVAVGPDGRAASLGGLDADRFEVGWINAAGERDIAIYNNPYQGAITWAGPPNTIRAGVFASGALVGVGGEAGGHIAKLSTTDGLYDTTFGDGGHRLIDSGVVLDDVVRDAEGRFVVSGFVSASKALFVARVTSDGALDSTFPAAVSVVTKPFTLGLCISGCRTFERSGRLALQGNGLVVVAGQIEEQGTTKCVALRYTGTGQLDAAFGDGGKAVVPVAGCVAKRIHVQPDERIVIGGPQIVRLWD